MLVQRARPSRRSRSSRARTSALSGPSPPAPIPAPTSPCSRRAARAVHQGGEQREGRMPRVRSTVETDSPRKASWMRKSAAKNGVGLRPSQATPMDDTGSNVHYRPLASPLASVMKWTPRPAVVLDPFSHRRHGRQPPLPPRHPHRPQPRIPQAADEAQIAQTPLGLAA